MCFLAFCIFLECCLFGSFVHFMTEWLDDCPLNVCYLEFLYSNLLIYYLLYASVCTYDYGWHNTCVEVGEQLLGVVPLISTYSFMDRTQTVNIDKKGSHWLWGSLHILDINPLFINSLQRFFFHSSVHLINILIY